MIDTQKIFGPLTGGMKEIRDNIRDKKDISVFGMQWSDRTVAAAALSERFLYVCADFVAAKNSYEQLQCLRQRVVYLPAKDDVLAYTKNQSQEGAYERLAALFSTLCGQADVVVTTVEAMAQLYPERSRFLDHMLTVKQGGDYDLEGLVTALTASGYRREEQISGKGQFALRGDILDIAPIQTDDGVRIEFFDTQVESIKTFDYLSQISGAIIAEVSVCPSCEVFLSEEEAEHLLSELKRDIPKNLDAEYYHRAESIVSDLAQKLLAGTRDMSLSYVLPYTPHNTFAEFFRFPVIIYDEVKHVNLKMVLDEHNNRYKQLLQKGEVFPRTLSQLRPEGLAYPAIRISFLKTLGYNHIFEPKAVVNFNSMVLPGYTRDYALLMNDLRVWLGQGYRIFVFCGSKEVQAKLSEQLRDQVLPYTEGYGISISLLDQTLNKGAIFHEQKAVLIGTYDLIAKKSAKIIRRSKKDVFTNPKIGEYVVHYVHGIGICDSITKLENNGVQRDYLVVRYRDGDKLYVPIENMDSLSKYSAGEESPKLSKIGGAEFAKAKERVKQSVKQMAFDLVKLYAERNALRGYRYREDAAAMQEFEDGFPYVETDDQLQAISEGLNDLKQGKIMDRLLCGDVGYGKTEVALRLAYKVILEGKQVAFLSPTTILARQHVHTAKERMEKYGVSVGSLTRLDSPASIKATIEKLQSGQVDILCGTHRILSKDVRFSDLGLLILDEEQRFGVADKEKIKLLKKNVNVLSLSATPIPRTLHMSMVGIRDISVLDTPPAERIPVQTYVTEYTEGLVRDAVLREVNRGGQVFVVYNRVASIEKFTHDLGRIVPEFRIGYVHGQLQKEKMEQVITAFLEGEIDILVASTIIENGIDMPRANTMIVVDADRLGLSQLYQLRGRIGRSNRLGYVFFTYDSGKLLTETAYKRLEAITEFTEFGSGFKIAMRDLEIRGAGNILGREQHGHMEKVGYDMYCKLLSETVEEMKGGSAAPEKEVKVSIDFDAFLPEHYIKDGEWRIKVYSRISHLSSQKEVSQLLDDLYDIYGKVPVAVKNLAGVALIKNLAAKAGASKVLFKMNENSVNYEKVVEIPKAVLQLVDQSPECTLKIQSMPAIHFGGGEKGKSNLVNFLIKCQDFV